MQGLQDLLFSFNITTLNNNSLLNKKADSGAERINIAQS